MATATANWRDRARTGRAARPLSGYPERASLSYGPGWGRTDGGPCERLQFHADHNTMPPVEITQAKEKWGELSVNYAGGDAHAGGLIDMAEAPSAHVREVCGSPGTCRRPAFRTRCAAHTGPAPHLIVRPSPLRLRPSGRTQLAGVHRRPHRAGIGKSCQ